MQIDRAQEPTALRQVFQRTVPQTIATRKKLLRKKKRRKMLSQEGVLMRPWKFSLCGKIEALSNIPLPWSMPMFGSP
jgi:hypothetical protein